MKTATQMIKDDLLAGKVISSIRGIQGYNHVDPLRRIRELQEKGWPITRQWAYSGKKRYRAAYMTPEQIKAHKEGNDGN